LAATKAQALTSKVMVLLKCMVAMIAYDAAFENSCGRPDVMANRVLIVM
jgi:hypothetical protein